MALISLQQVTLDYRAGSRTVRALDGVSLEISAGDYWVVSGAAASGKSSLLNVLALLDAPSSGAVVWQGARVAARDTARRQQLRLQSIGYIPQCCQLIDSYTVAQNIALGLAASTLAAAEREVRVATVMAQLSLGQLAHCLPAELSASQQQCVAIARAAVSEPALLLADAPTAQLDNCQARQVLRLFDTLNASGSAVVLVSHDMASLAHAGRSIELSGGRIIAEIQHRSQS